MADDTREYAKRSLEKTLGLAEKQLEWIRRSGWVMVDPTDYNGFGRYVQNFQSFLDYGKDNIQEPLRYLLKSVENEKVSESFCDTIRKKTNPIYSNARNALTSLIMCGRKARAKKTVPKLEELYSFDEWSKGKKNLEVGCASPWYETATMKSAWQAIGDTALDMPRAEQNRIIEFIEKQIGEEK